MSETIETRYRGVYPTSWGNTWQAVIQHNGRRYYLGVYQDAKEAARAYDRAASSVGRKFRNFPDSPNTDTGSRDN